MKNILKITAFAFLLISFASCTDTIDPKVSPNEFKMNALDPTGSFILSPLDGDNVLTTLSWEPADSGVATVSPKYTVEIAKAGTNFAAPIVASTPSTVLQVVWQEGYLNILLLNSGFVPDAVADLDVRVKSILGDNTNILVQYSNTVTMKVTPFAQPALAFTKVGDNPANAPKTKSSGLYSSDCEGYAYLEAGNYRFYTAIGGMFESSNAFYGDNGSGALVLNGAAINVATAGFYLIKSDISKSPKTYSITASSWGVFGAATPFPSAVNKKMVYNAVSKKWEITLLIAGGKAFKFRNTATPALILGVFDATKTGVDYAGLTLSYSGKDIILAGTVPETYLVSLDLNTPRAYTYTTVKQ